VLGKRELNPNFSANSDSRGNRPAGGFAGADMRGGERGDRGGDRRDRGERGGGDRRGGGGGRTGGAGARK